MRTLTLQEAWSRPPVVDAAVRTYLSNGGVVYHIDPSFRRQPNDRFSHRLEWSRYCTLCMQIKRQQEQGK
jgi:hypothetical protein